MTRSDFLRLRALGRHKLPPSMLAEYDYRDRMELLLAGQPETNGAEWIGERIGLVDAMMRAAAVQWAGWAEEQERAGHG